MYCTHTSLDQSVSQITCTYRTHLLLFTHVVMEIVPTVCDKTTGHVALSTAIASQLTYLHLKCMAHVWCVSQGVNFL